MQNAARCRDMVQYSVYAGLFKCNKKRIIDYPNLWGYLRDLYQTPGFGSTTNHFHIEHHYQVSSLLHMDTHVVGTYTHISILWDQPPLLVCGTWKCCLDKCDYPASLVCYATNDVLRTSSPSWAPLRAFCLLFIGCRRCPPNLELALDTAVCRGAAAVFR